MDNIKATHGNDTACMKRMSIIGEGEDPVVHMAHLGIVGSRKVNGVAALHSRLVKETMFKDFDELYPDKIHQQNQWNNSTKMVEAMQS